METRELYRQKYEAQIAEWSAKVASLKAKGERLTAQARIDMQPRVDAVHSRKEAVEARLRELAEATDERWDEVRERAEGAWHEFKSAVEGAYDALTSAARSRDDEDDTQRMQHPSSR